MPLYTLTHADGTKDETVEMPESVAMATNRENAERNNPWRYESSQMAPMDEVFDAQDAVIAAAVELASTAPRWNVGGQLCWCECKREQGMLDGTKRHGYLCRRMNALRDAVTLMKSNPA